MADNRYVHQWIAREAYSYFTNRIAGADLGAHLGTLAGSFGDSDDNLLEGTRDEDIAGENPAPPFSAYYLLPYIEHFCAGADGAELDDGLWSSPAAITRANWYWTNYVLPRYTSNPASCFYYLGHVAHLLIDLTVPAHTHNDDHVGGEPFEDAMAVDGTFKQWFFGCTRNGLATVWTFPLGTDYADLRALFQRTANYTEDYDSLDVPGDVSAGAAAYDPGDYPTAWHRPQDVDRSGGMSPEELTITADDLVPYSIRRVAELYRLLYKSADTTPPVVTLLVPNATNPESAAMRGTLMPFTLSASATDPQSGVVRAGYRFAWCHQEPGGGWSEWHTLSPEPGSPAVTFTPTVGEGLYAFRVTAENGGGATTESPPGYVRITLPQPPYLRLSCEGTERVVLSWTGRTGEVYAVEQRADLIDPPGWAAMATDLPATPPLNTYTDAVHSVTRRFYRVQASVPDSL